MSTPSAHDRRPSPSLPTRLARLGFGDPAGAERLLAEAGPAVTAELLDDLGATPDPDLALRGLVALLAGAERAGEAAA
ncbi:hypothetical protein, partial [Actinomadura logoneensis]|uniref:hypothetical protein n=1 Tax=Actinomadura logoneensis TaxID=2293572 RepID=UPI001314C38D